jgi:hypothetical protein
MLEYLQNYNMELKDVDKWLVTVHEWVVRSFKCNEFNRGI